MPQAVEENILREIQIEKSLIENPDTPLRHYNYSYVKNLLETKYIQKVSLSTIIDRAKKHDFYVKKRPKKILITGRLTNYGGEIIYHDSPYHLWSSPAKEKCYLITSLDDFSRFMLYVTLLKKEASWAHILFLQTVVLRHGALFLYYVDSPFNLSVCERQGLPAVDITYPHWWADRQWKQVMDDCKIKVTYALFPQAKGKIEKSYGWLQDRLIRICVKEHVTDIREDQRVVTHEVFRYSYRPGPFHHSTGSLLRFSTGTGEEAVFGLGV